MKRIVLGTNKSDTVVRLFLISHLRRVCTSHDIISYGGLASTIHSLIDHPKSPSLTIL